jgi:hypothetical protein
MLLRELLEDSASTLTLVFKGMHGDSFPGNQQCIQLAKQLNAEVFEYTQRADALRLIKSKQPQKLVLIGYSAGVKTVIDISQQHKPVLSILIAGYPTTLQMGEGKIQGAYVNYYQPSELDGILRSKGMPAYRPQGGVAKPMDVAHDKIVAAATSDIVSRVQAVQ